MPKIINCRTEKIKHTRQKEKNFISPHLRWWGRLTMPTTQTFQSENYRFLCFRYVRSKKFVTNKIYFPERNQKFIEKTNISIEISSSDIAIISNFINSRLIIIIQTKSLDVYSFCLQICSFQRAAISGLCFAANRYLCSEEELIKFPGKNWKNSMLDVCEKHFLYKFAYAIFKDQEKRCFFFLRLLPNVSIVI